MDNHFVPNLSWGLPVVEAVLAHSSLPVDAHLMIRDADRWAPAYAEAGCQIVTPHAEARRRRCVWRASSTCSAPARASP